MKRAIIAAGLAASFATSAQDPFLAGEALQAEIVKSCAEGCVTFSREQAAAFEERIGMVIARKMQEAFAAGIAHQRASCASLI